jgi:acyl carrier protein
LEEALRERIRRVFGEALGLDDGVDIEGLEYRAVKQWDSVGHMQLVAALEEEFDIMLEMDEITGMSSFERAVEIVARHADEAP